MLGAAQQHHHHPTTRPKSQPPIRFSESIRPKIALEGQHQVDEDEEWNKLIDQYEKSHSLIAHHKYQQDKSSVCFEEEEEEEEGVEAISPISSLSASSSSSTSLASSALSLTSNSSVSTVLAALDNKCQFKQQHHHHYQQQQQDSKSMIARYIQQASQCDQPTSVAQREAGGLANASGAQEAQPLSSPTSSSSSSSSGLSSMSLAPTRGHPNVPQLHNIATDQSSMEIDVVGECLSQLIGDVVAITDKGVPIEYDKFQIHEAVLAQTRSTTTTSGSSDEECSSSKDGSIAKRCAPAKEHNVALWAEAYMVRQLSVEAIKMRNDYSHVIDIARRHISDALDEANESEQRESIWLVGLRRPLAGQTGGALPVIEWHQPAEGKQIQCAHIGQILDCLVEQQLLVWILARPANQVANHALDLDDIALALNEPISGGGGGGGSQTANIAQLVPLDQNNNNNHVEHPFVDALIWLCSSSSQAKQLQEAWMSCVMSEKSSMGNDHNPDDDAHHLEVSASKQLVVEDNGQLTRQEDAKRAEAPATEQVNGPMAGLSGVKSVPVKVANVAAAAIDCRQSRKANNLSSGLDEAPVRSSLASTKQPANNCTNGLANKRPLCATHNKSTLTQPTTTTTTTTTSDNKINARLAKNNNTNEVPQAKSCLIEQTNEPQQQQQRIKKSSSGLDLRASQQQSGASLTSYYRGLASKVKTFKDEMIKLNSRLPAHSLAASARRISMAIQSDRTRHQPHLSSSGSVCDLSSGSSSSASPSSTLDSSSSGDSLGPKQQQQAQQQQQQQQHQDRPQASSNQTSDVPMVKPRTSILKKKKCDSNNNLYDSIGRRPLVLGDDTGQPSGQSAGKRSPPKSILKNGSKSMVNISTNQATAGCSPFITVSSNKCNGNSIKQEIVGRDDSSKCAMAGVKDNSLDTNNNKLCEQQQQHPTRRLLGSDNKQLANNNHKRRSLAASHIRRLVSADVHQQASGGERTGEHSFERLGQLRASCYDISRLMSTTSNSKAGAGDNLQSQLTKLRAGSTGSVAASSSKSRQRRPALLLDESKHIGHHGQRASSSGPSMANNVPINVDEMRKCSSTLMDANVVTTTSSGADGTVRARVSAAQLTKQQQTSDANWMNEIRPSGGQRKLASVAASVVAAEDEARPTMAKKSEFDPRSLRGLPAELAAALRADQNGDLDMQSRRKSMASVKQLSSIQKKLVECEPSVMVSEDGVMSDDDIDDLLDENNNLKPSPLSKRGKLSLLRQSFNQKTLSSMLSGLSGRASFRVKQTPTSESQPKSSVAIAEANLLAAKQLKQQAQKLKEQQKRVAEQQQQQQAAMIDSTALMLYNQHVQRQQQQHHHHHQQQQQQQMMYAQQYATSVQMYQRQQQMAQFMSMMQPPMMYMPPAPTCYFKTHSSFNIVYAGGPQQAHPMMYPQQHPPVMYPQAQMQPMAPIQQRYMSIEEPVPVASSNSNAPPKGSSLGASMRKTVKSILISRSSFLSSSGGATATNSNNNNGSIESPTAIANGNTKTTNKQLKSALKSSGGAQLMLNSEGSDGDGSSSDSTHQQAPNSKTTLNHAPKSVLKKRTQTSPQQTPQAGSTSSSSSDSSLTSATTRISFHQPRDKNSTLTQRDIDQLRQELRAQKGSHTMDRDEADDDDDDDVEGDDELSGSTLSSMTASSSRRLAVVGPNTTTTTTTRKNVTFSTKLTSIL